MYLCDMCVLGMRCDFFEGAVAPCVAIFPLVRYAPTPTGGGNPPRPPFVTWGCVLVPWGCGGTDIYKDGNQKGARVSVPVGADSVPWPAWSQTSGPK